VTLPPDEAVVQMQRAVQAAFAGSSLSRYEVSNYAREGYHSRHNALYWTGGEYLALGSGATGFLRTSATTGERYANHRSAEKYLEAMEGPGLPTASVEALTAGELLSERIAMGLRLVSGVDLAAVCRAFGEDPAARLEKAAHLARNGLLTREGPRVKATERGMDVHSALAAHLM
jgi:oxygen-independent coproporphyrinogen-3 oxidase